MGRDLLLASVLEVLWGIEQFSVMFRTETTNEKLCDAPQDKRKVVKPAANRLFMAKEPNPVRRPGFSKGLFNLNKHNSVKLLQKSLVLVHESPLR